MEADKQYERLDLIGSGAYGKVYKGKSVTSIAHNNSLSYTDDNIFTPTSL